MVSNPPPVPVYAAHVHFAARAGDKTEPWRTLIGAFLFVAAFLFLPTSFGSTFLSGDVQDDFYDGLTRMGVLLQFGVMILPILALKAIMTGLHGRGLWSAVGRPTQAILLGMAVAKIVFLVLLAEEILPPWPMNDTLSVIRPLIPWLLTVPFAVVVVLIQVTGEELFFRGYLQQQIAARTANPFLWMVLPSAVFGIAHYANADGPAAGVLWALWATGLGLACADLTARTGSLGPAIGLHLVNNLFALLLYGMEGGPSSGLALMLVPYVDPTTIDQSLRQLLTPGGVLETLMMGLEIAVLWIAARIAIRR